MEGRNYFVAYLLVPVHVTRFLTAASTDLVLMHAAAVSSMQYTHLIPGSTPLHYGRVGPSLQIFSVKLAEIRGGLEWPLPVYGTVAARDHVDHNRNLLFARNRSECQTLNEEVSISTILILSICSSFDFGDIVDMPAWPGPSCLSVANKVIADACRIPF